MESAFGVREQAQRDSALDKSYRVTSALPAHSKDVEIV